MALVKNLAKKLATQLRFFVRMATGEDGFSMREFVAKRYLKGEGIEIGALDRPLAVAKGVRVRYVDRLSVKELRVQYPEYLNKKLVNVDIVDDGQALGKVPAESQDFVIANHFLEHCPDPIRSLQNMFRVLRPMGVLFLTIPDKRYTFDRDRPVTDFEHLAKDFHEGPERSKVDHFREWVEIVGKVGDATKVSEEVKELIRKDYSIHFHVWTQKEMIELFLKVGEYFKFQPEIEIAMKNGPEVVLVISRGATGGASSLN